MSTRQAGTVTHLLAGWRSRAPEADERLTVAVYGELRKLAAAYLRRERPGHTLQPTAIVHEAYLRLEPQRSVEWKNRAHFFGIAAQMMRRVLVDHARRRRALRRGVAAPVTVSNLADPRGRPAVDVLAVHEALTELAHLDPRQARIVELRFFGGLTVDEIAQAVGVSPRTIKRELATARLWLEDRLRDRR